MSTPTSVNITKTFVRPNNAANTAVGAKNPDVVFNASGTIVGAALESGTGDKILNGGDAADTYIWAKGDGNAVIVDVSYNETGTVIDTLQLTDLNYADIELSRDQTNLYITVTATGEKITVSNHFASNTDFNYSLERILFADGTAWDRATLDQTPYRGVVLTGTSAAETFLGTAGFDLIVAGGGADTLNGGTGDDSLNGGEGADTYLWAKGDGNDSISDIPYSETGTDIDTLKLTDLNPADIVLNRDQYNLYITVTATGEKITVYDHFCPDANFDSSLERILFADDTVWDKATLDQTPYQGTDEADTLYGTSAADTFLGAMGDDTLYGGNGADTYLWAKGDGNDVINELSDGETGTVIDTLKLTDLNPADIELNRDENNLYITVKATGEKITVTDHFSFTTYFNLSLERILFADGTAWDKATLDQTPYQGTDGADILYGTSAAETFIGGKGDDVIDAGGGADTLHSGAGDDILYGGEGADTYLWAKGDGNDLIADFPLNEPGTVIDTLKLTDLNPADIVLNRNGFALYITVTATGEKIKVEGQYILSNGAFNNSSLEQILFADGTAWDKATLDETPYRGTDSVDNFHGSYNAETFIGGKEGDYLNGGNGADTYLWAKGDGNDVIRDISFNEPDTVIDTLKLTDLKPADIVLSRDQNHLYVIVTATGEKITVDSHFSPDPYYNFTYSLERILFADGSAWDKAILDQTPYRGSDDADTLTGTYAAETFIGGKGDDVIKAGGGADTLYGGTGSDQLYGGEGADTYLWAKGDGNDAIIDYSYNESGTVIDTLKLTDLKPTDIVLNRDYNNLYVTVTATGEKITVSKHFAPDTYSNYSLERILFADGTAWNKATLDQTPYRGTDGVDNLFGTSAAETFIGGKGSDNLNGGNGADTYLWAKGDGNDVIRDVSSNEPGTVIDTLKLTDLKPADIVLSRDQNHLYVNVTATGEKITVFSHFSPDTYYNYTYSLERILFADGTAWNKSVLNNANYAATGSVVVNGRPIENQTLTATNTLADLDGLGTVAYQWQSSTDGTNWSAITGATTSSLKLTNAQVFKQVRVMASYTDGHGTLERMVSSATNDILNINDGTAGSVTVTGKTTQNQTLTATNTLADADGLGTVAYQWESSADGTNWSAITGATASSLKLTEAQVGKHVRAMASYTDGHFTRESKASSATAAIANVNDTPTGSVTLSGLAYQNQTLTASHNLADEDGLGAITYQWQSSSDGKKWTAISGATGASLTLSSALTGKLVQAVARYTDGHGTVDSMASASTLVLNHVLGTAGADVLTGTTGGDLLEGLAGNDTYTVNHAGDVVLEASTLASEIDTVLASVTYSLGNNLENLTLTGSTAINATGNALNNTLTGNKAGNLIDGGSGADLLVGGLGNDTYVVDNAGDVISETSTLSSEIDTVVASVTYTLGNNLENLTLTGSTAINATGNALKNRLTGNSAANILDGGTGADTMIGSLGDDIYFVDVATDVVTENLNEGFDLVNSAVTLTLAANAEALFLSGSNALNGTGNALNNLIRGNAANNTLNGGSGNDLLEGGAGNDVLTDTAGAALFNGGAGNDTLTGGAGVEIFQGGSGNDLLTTGAGNDLILFNKGDGQDTVAAGGTGKDTLSLGGGIAYADLALSKVSNDLVLKVGAAESITFKNWYAATPSKPVVNLQVIAEAMADFVAGGSDPLKDQRVESFNFTGLVGAFDAARVANTGLTSWALSNALTKFQLAGSDSAALGGDIAYQYGKNGNLAAIGVTSALETISSSSLGTTAQTLNLSATLQSGSLRLS